MTGSDDRTFRFWDRSSGCPIGPALRSSFELFAVAFHPDGKTVLAAAARPEAGDVEVLAAQAPLGKTGSRNQIEAWCEVLTGLALDDVDGERVLDAAEWLSRRRLLDDPPLEALEPDGPVALNAGTNLLAQGRQRKQGVGKRRPSRGRGRPAT